MLNVHLIIKKTVIQARKLGRGAARSQWKKPHVPREFPSSPIRPELIDHIDRVDFPFFRSSSILSHDLPLLWSRTPAKIGEWRIEGLEGIDRSEQSEESRDWTCSLAEN